ncbi:transmembrane protein [Anaeramoeba flamelloides]|uniref:Transmembrane protein n=1 Tax=Anaeramoeba flamelloides TaxID=1746091 RepID=A0ABQ8X5V2_9EUKA|nr:transmembrane protein [Anaeramoeba flamelloides]
MPIKLDLDELDLGDVIAEDEIPNNTTDNLWWFFHISDIHVSSIDAEHQKTLEKFILNYGKRLQPRLILATGDLTNGSPRGREFGKITMKEEFDIYKSTLEQCDVYDPNFWYDVRGNHDGLGVMALNSENNYYYTTTPQEERLEFQDSNPVYSFDVEAGNSNYNFVMMDTTRYPKPVSPFGYFTQFTTEFLDQFEKKIANSKKYDHTILYGHHPLCFIAQNLRTSKSKKTFKELIEESRVLAYLNGHLHVEGMHSDLFDPKKGLFEFEVVDLAYDDGFRIFAFDNNLFTLEDKTMKATEKEPIIVITNPKKAKILSNKEPLKKIQQSTHIRALIFLNHTITDADGDDYDPYQGIKKVTCEINGKLTDSPMTRVSNDHPLFVTPWNPSDYTSQDLNSIEIIVEMDDGNTYIEAQTFSVNGQREKIGNSATQVRQRGNILEILMILLSYFVAFYFVGCLVVPKILKYWLVRKQKYSKFDKKFNQVLADSNNGKLSLWHSIIYNIPYALWKFGKLSKPTYSILMASLTLTLITPISIGKLFTNEYGSNFIWGTVSSVPTIPFMMNVMIIELFLILSILPAIYVFAIPSTEAGIGKKTSPLRILKSPYLYWFGIGTIFHLYNSIPYITDVLGIVPILLSPAYLWNTIFLFICVIVFIKKDYNKVISEKRPSIKDDYSSNKKNLIEKNTDLQLSDTNFSHDDDDDDDDDDDLHKNNTHITKIDLEYNSDSNFHSDSSFNSSSRSSSSSSSASNSVSGSD